MIGLHISGPKGMQEEYIKHTCDILLSPLGLRTEISRGNPPNKNSIPVVIHYGNLLITENWMDYIRDGGIVIAILNHDSPFRKKQSPSIPFDDQTTESSSVEDHAGYYINRMGKKVPLVFSRRSLRDDFGRPLYFLEDGVTPVARIKKQGDGVFIKLGVDIIQSTSVLLFKKHTLVVGGEDTVKFICNEYAVLLQELIARGCQELGIPSVRLCTWPYGKPFAVCLCHDVDWTSNWRLRFFEIVKRIFGSIQLCRKQEFRKAAVDLIAELSIRPRRLDMHSSIKKEIEFERRLGFIPTFFFFGTTRARRCTSGERTYVTARETLFLRQLTKRGVEIGLHGSYPSYTDGSMLAAEKKILESSGIQVHGVRQHCNRFEAGKTWEAQEFAGLEYDATRTDCPFCFPFEAFHAEHDREKNGIVEIPLSIMDEDLTRHPRPSILSEKRREFIEKVKGITEAVNAYKGVLVFQWHPFEKYRGCLSTYHEILCYIDSLNPYKTTCYGILDWWRQRSSVRIHWRRKSEGVYAVKVSATEDISNVCFAMGNVKETSLIEGPVQTKWDNISGDVYCKIERLKEGEEILVEIKV